MTSMPVALYICGDVHLQPADRGAFFAFLDQLHAGPAAHLVILGDLFEYWVDHAAMVRAYDPLFQRLRGLQRAGWHLHLVPGNRELAAGGYLYKALRWTVHHHGWRLRIAGLRLRIVHGDQLVRDPGYRFMAALVRSWWLRAWRYCLPGLLQQGIARALRSRSQARQRRVGDRGAPLALLDPRRVAAAGRGCERICAGHIHQQWRQPIRGIDMILCGHWEVDWGHWVEIDSQGQAHLCRQDFPIPAKL